MLFFITVTVLLASVQAKFYTDCGSKLATIQSVNISNCAQESSECVLKRNTNVTINVEFTPSVNGDNLEAVVHGIIMNLPVPFPLPQPDACKDSGLVCPIKSGEKVSYTSSMAILKSYPKVKVDVKWELRNPEEEDFICLIVSARLH